MLSRTAKYIYTKFVAIILVIVLLSSPLGEKMNIVQEVHAVAPLVAAAILLALESSDILFTAIDVKQCIDGDDLSCTFFMGEMYLLYNPLPGDVTLTGIGRSVRNVFANALQKNIDEIKNIDELAASVKNLSNADKIKVFKETGSIINPDLGEVFTGSVPMMNYKLGKSMIGSLDGQIQWHHLIPELQGRLTKAMGISSDVMLSIPIPTDEHIGNRPFSSILTELARNNFGGGDIVFTKNNVKNFTEDIASFYKQLGMEKYAAPAIAQFLNSPGVVKALNPMKEPFTATTLKLVGVKTFDQFVEAAWQGLISSGMPISTNDKLNFGDVDPLALIPMNMEDVTTQYAGKTVVIRSSKTNQYFNASTDKVTGASNMEAATRFTISEITDDGWVGFKASNGKYVQESDSENMLKACGDNLLSWECMRIYKQNGMLYIMTQKSHRLWQVSDSGSTVMAARPINIGGASWEAIELLDATTNSVIQTAQVPIAETTPSISGTDDLWFSGGNVYTKSNASESTDYIPGRWCHVAINYNTVNGRRHVVSNDCSDGYKLYGWVDANLLSGSKPVESIATNVDPVPVQQVPALDISPEALLSGYPVADVTNWKLKDLLPSAAAIAETKWVYDITLTIESTKSELPGWTMIGSQWNIVSSGEREWADFPAGFSKSNAIYNAYDKKSLDEYENELSKRTVTNVLSRYVYWHWVVREDKDSYDRYINEFQGALPEGNFTIFHALESDTNLPMSIFPDAYIWNAGPYSSYYWYRTNLYKSIYTDYTKVYRYTRTIRTESSEYPTTGNVSNVIQYCKVPKKEIYLFIGYPSMSTDSGWKEFDNQGTKPIIKNGRTMLPIRAIIEELGGKVEWDAISVPKAPKITCILGDKIAVMSIGVEHFYVNGLEYKFETAPIIENGRTMIPLRALLEALGCQVYWTKDGGGAGFDQVEIEYEE